MPTHPPLPVSLTPPTRDEAQALRVAGNYLVRAGTEATRRLFAAAQEGEAEALATLSDNLLAGAILCARLLDAPEQSSRP